MGLPSLPAFVTERRAGLLDFWTVYEGAAEELPETSVQAALRQPKWTEALPPGDAAELVAQWQKTRALLRAAIVDDAWTPYVEHMQALGRRFAELGIELASWSTVMRIFQHRVVPALVEAYAATPPRLGAALLAVADVVELSMALVATRYCETVQEDRLRRLVDGVNSERQTAEAERRAQEERFRALATATTDAIVTADHRGVITYANHATATLFGRPAAELVGQPLTVLMPAHLREAHTRGLARYLASREARALGRTVEMPALRSDGTERAVEMSVTTWRERGESAFAAIMRDVSERKQIEATLEQRTRQLERTNRETEAFSYSVAHELRAPLRGIQAFASALIEDHAGALCPDARDHLARVQGNAKRMAALIDALLALSRLSRTELELQPLDLSALARAAVAQLVAAEPHRSVEVHVDPGLRATANSRLVRTLLENLIGNAWKFTSKTAAPQIAIGTTNGTTFFVRDNGAGFDLAQAGKLFAPFERLHSADEFPGTGIGLATVQRIVHHHGGRIWVKAQVGAGATFFFTLAPAE